MSTKGVKREWVGIQNIQNKMKKEKIKQCNNCVYRNKCYYKSIPCKEFKEDKEDNKNLIKHIEKEFPNYGELERGK